MFRQCLAACIIKSNIGVIVDFKCFILKKNNFERILAQRFHPGK